ncbi:hypothetical protein DL93DRAFT_2173046 [Clavulina sp. PMI_390]|nr:hypothetical protein DL93DRAFT_2173046 [Clavulina sp. PMI_390]
MPSNGPIPTTTPIPGASKRAAVPSASNLNAIPSGRIIYPTPSPPTVSLQERTIASTLKGVPKPIPILSGVATLPTPPSTPPYGLAAGYAPSTAATLSPLLVQLFPGSLNIAGPLSKGVSVQSFQEDGSIVQWDGFILSMPAHRAVPPTPPRRSSTASSSTSTSSSSSSISGSPPSPRSAFKGSRAAQAQAAMAAHTNAAMGGKASRTLYMSAQGAFKQYDRVRETIVALLDLASEHLECDAVVMVLDRTMGAAGESSAPTRGGTTAFDPRTPGPSSHYPPTYPVPG